MLRCRAWSEYGHCQSKLEQVLRDYAVMKGLQAGPDMDDERLAGAERDIGGDWSDEEGEGTPGKKAAGKASAAVVPIDDGPKAGDAEKAAGEDDFGDFAGERSTAQGEQDRRSHTRLPGVGASSMKWLVLTGRQRVLRSISIHALNSCINVGSEGRDWDESKTRISQATAHSRRNQRCQLLADLPVGRFFTSTFQKASQKVEGKSHLNHG